MAILETLKVIEKENIRRAYIFSDSLSVLLACISRYPEPKMSYLKLWIKELAWTLSQREIDVKLYWIPAHVGIKFNEEADRGAKEAIPVGSDTQLLLPYTDLLQKFKAELKEEQLNWYRETSQVKGTTFFRCSFAFDAVPWYERVKINRNAVVSINRIRCNHNSLNNILNRFNIVESDMCKCNESQDTPDHIFGNLEDLTDREGN